MSPKTTKLYDRTADTVTVDETLERIASRGFGPHQRQDFQADPDPPTAVA